MNDVILDTPAAPLYATYTYDRDNADAHRDMFSKFPDLLSISELQKALGIGRSTAYRLITDDTIKHLRIGRNLKIPRCYLIEYVDKLCYDNNKTGYIIDDSQGRNYL